MNGWIFGVFMNSSLGSIRAVYIGVAIMAALCLGFRKLITRRLMFNILSFLMACFWGNSNQDTIKDGSLKLHSNLARVQKYGEQVAQNGLNGIYPFISQPSKNNGKNYLKPIVGKYFLQKTKLARLKAEKIMALYPSPLSEWMVAVFLGKKANLGVDMVSSYAFFGVVHLLVISGQHITWLAGLCSLLMKTPFHLLYIFRKISVFFWIYFDVAATVAIGFLVIFYMCVVEFQPACQRAVIMYWITKILPIFIGKDSVIVQMKIAFIIQSILFPSDVLSLSSALSWGSYIIFLSSINSFSSVKLTLFPRIVENIELQAMLSIFSWSLVGNVSIFCILGNLIMAPIFTMLLLMSCVLLGTQAWWANSVFSKKLIWVETEVLNSTIFATKLLSEHILLHWRISTDLNLMRIILALTSCVIILASLKKLSIKKIYAK